MSVCNKPALRNEFTEVIVKLLRSCSVLSAVVVNGYDLMKTSCESRAIERVSRCAASEVNAYCRKGDIVFIETVNDKALGSVGEAAVDKPFGVYPFAER